MPIRNNVFYVSQVDFTFLGKPRKVLNQIPSEIADNPKIIESVKLVITKKLL